MRFGLAIKSPSPMIFLIKPLMMTFDLLQLPHWVGLASVEGCILLVRYGFVWLFFFELFADKVCVLMRETDKLRLRFDHLVGSWFLSSCFYSAAMHWSLIRLLADSAISTGIFLMTSSLCLRNEDTCMSNMLLTSRLEIVLQRLTV